MNKFHYSNDKMKLNFIPSHLANSIGQNLDDLVMRCGDDTLPIYFDDAVPNPDASSLSYTTTHQTANLR